MSIESEILRIQHNVANAYAAVAEKGGEVPAQPTSASLAGAVQSIQTGISEERLQEALSAKQDALTGGPGQVVGFGADGGAASVPRWSNPNLLDNWYWVDRSAIVNQRGREEYTQAGYTIDRWYTPNGCGFSLTDHGISSTVNSSGTGAGNVLRSCYENCEYLRGKTVTASILIHHTDSAVCKPLIQIVGGSQNGQGFCPPLETQIAEGVYSFTTTLPDDMTGLWFWIYFGDMRHDSGGEISTVKAAKLELGSTQTLAHQDAGGNWVLNDPPPDPALELLKCQRYFVSIPYVVGRDLSATIANGYGVANFHISLPVNMRSGNPGISVDGQLRIHVNGGDYQNVSIESTGILQGNILSIVVPSLTPNTVYSLDSAVGGHIYIDRNL